MLIRYELDGDKMSMTESMLGNSKLRALFLLLYKWDRKFYNEDKNRIRELGHSVFEFVRPLSAIPTKSKSPKGK